MEKRRGRPPKGSGQTRGELMQVRLDPTEREAFKDAAALAGVPLSAWVRERLRQAALKELRAAEHPIAFLKHVTLD
jgi:predicted HicB family RNase H-like nuclease